MSSKKRKNFWQHPPCNQCGKKKVLVVWDNVTTWEHEGVFQIVECANCHLKYLSPRPVQEKIGHYYKSESYWGNDTKKFVIDRWWRNKREKDYGFLYRQILQRKEKGKILDLGAGIGTFLSRFKELGWQTEGVEFSPAATEFSQKVFNINLKTGDFLDFNFPKNKYDVVTLNNVLEHLYDPFKTLKKVKKVLATDGILLVTVPNINSLGASFFKDRWYALQPPRHLYHFSQKTLTNMLEKAGFEVTEINRWYWIHNYFTFFESIRLAFSPRFEQKKQGGLVTEEENYLAKYSLKKEVSKVFAKCLAFTLAAVGSMIGRSEVICMVATKKT